MKSKRDLSWSVLGILIFCLLVLSSIFAFQINKFNQINEYLNGIEYINSSTQRLVKLVLLEHDTKQTESYLNSVVVSYLDFSSNVDLYSSYDDNFIENTQHVLDSWYEIREVISQEEINFDNLYLASDNSYFKMTELSLTVNKYLYNISNGILIIEMSLLLIMFLISLIIANNIIQTKLELKYSNKMAKLSQIDSATGLYNRSKCQELFKTERTDFTQKIAVLVFDLNDLKKTNDVHGHAAGDELISSFANSLKSACDSNKTAPFLGRYGGDEFIVIYDSIDNINDVTNFLRNLTKIKEETNKNATQFQISYAVGFATSIAKEQETLSAKELFDIADEAMYVNKKEVKAAKEAKEAENKVVD